MILDSMLSQMGSLPIIHTRDNMTTKEYEHVFGLLLMTHLMITKLDIACHQLVYILKMVLRIINMAQGFQCDA